MLLWDLKFLIITGRCNLDTWVREISIQNPFDLEIISDKRNCVLVFENLIWTGLALLPAGVSLSGDFLPYRASV